MFCLIIWCIETMLSLWSYTIYIPYITKRCHGKQFVTFCSKFKLGLPRRHYAFLHGGKCLLDNFYNPLINSYNVMSCRVDDIIVYATVVTKYSHVYTSSIKLLQWQQKLWRQYPFTIHELFCTETYNVIVFDFRRTSHYNLGWNTKR